MRRWTQRLDCKGWNEKGAVVKGELNSVSVPEETSARNRDLCILPNQQRQLSVQRRSRGPPNAILEIDGVVCGPLYLHMLRVSHVRYGPELNYVVR